MSLKRDTFVKLIFFGLLIHQNSDTSYKKRQNVSWKPAQVTKLEFQKFNSTPLVKVSAWDLDGRSQVTILGRKWVWNRNNCRNYFFLGFLDVSKSQTRYKSSQNGSWKPAQVTKLDFRKNKSPPRVKFLVWDLDGRSQVSSLGRKWVWKGKHCWNKFFCWVIDPSKLGHQV